jgi:hypothetical protein
MAAKSKTGISGTRTQLPQSKPKRTKQGQGAHSKPSHGRKKLRGQGR